MGDRDEDKRAEHAQKQAAATRQAELKRRAAVKASQKAAEKATQPGIVTEV